MARRQTKADFVEFLERTLIPDLQESGAEATAQDFQICADAIRENRKSKRLSSYLARVGKDYKRSGKEFTAADYKRCARLVKP